MKRKPISKSVRFSVFARDGFTCRYCGKQSDNAVLEVDHVIPVCQGGTNDLENLITSCVDCNRGKGGKKIDQAAPSEADRLRLAQERNEQMGAAIAVKQAAEARDALRQEVVNYWCSVSGRKDVDTTTISIVCGYVEQFGADIVFRWIDKAIHKIPNNDKEAGKYISGIRRFHLKEIQK